MNYHQISNMAGSMMTWGHVIWIFFPIPLFCLMLLSMLPSYPRIVAFGVGCASGITAGALSEFKRFGTNLVGRIFFTRVSVGVLYIRLAYVFIGASLLIFGVAGRTIQMGFGSAHVPCSGTSCPFHSGETMWYRRASRYRAERNFWLSLFTLVLWILVYNIYMLKEQIVKLRGDLDSMRSEVIEVVEKEHKQKNAGDKKKD